LHEAADLGAGLMVFPEAYLSGYPAWIWQLRPGGDYGLTSEINTRLLENSIDLARGDLGPLQEAAAERGVVVVCGIHERDGEYSRSTIYNTLVTIDADGRVVNRHRKLVPTNPERMVWGQGDASGLRVVDTQAGRLGGLICWENYMPLARYALFADGVEIYIAPTWDSGEMWLATMRHIAAEGRCWVIGAGCSMHTDDLPVDFPDRGRLWPEDQWINPGDSVVVQPGGELVAGPLHEIHDLLVVEIDPATAAPARRTLDVSGHYARSDVFHLTIDRRSQTPAQFEDDEAVPS
jgi:nitrilase